jgi:glycosyltransferase involved in cell wall biosynthesis
MWPASDWFSRRRIPEMVQDTETGLLADPDNAADLARKILWLLEHNQERNAMAKAARDVRSGLSQCRGRRLPANRCIWISPPKGQLPNLVCKLKIQMRGTRFGHLREVFRRRRLSQIKVRFTPRLA